MKYKVGDKVRIREDLNKGEQYWMEDRSESNWTNSDMLRLKSKICTIKSIHGGQYTLEEDPDEFYWVDEMFTDISDTYYRDWVWGRGRSTLKVKEMSTSHIKNSISLLEKMNSEERLEDGHRVKEWIDCFNNELTYRKITPESRVKLVITDDLVKAYMDKDIELTKQYIKENKENIKMTNTQLIENKLEKELDALRKAKTKEIKDKFYETSIGKAAKAFNEVLEQDGSENQKDNYLIDMDDLMERSEENFVDEIDAKYDAKREEVKEYYAEAMSLFENADTYEQKHEILTSYGILKGPKAKAKVEVK